jgi:hypothetical protein
VLARPAPGGTRDASAIDPTALSGVWALDVGKRQPRRLPTPASASGARSLRRDGTADPRGGVSPHPRPVGPRSLRRDGRPTRRAEFLHPPRTNCSHLLSRTMANGRVVVKSAPRADRAMTPERAGPERPGRRVETLAPTERLMRGRGTARVRPSVCVPPQAGSHAQAGRRAGLEAQPERPLPARGAKQKPHAVKGAKPAPSPPAKKRSRSETKETGVRGGALRGFRTRRATCCSAAG